MQAMVLRARGAPLELADVQSREPGAEDLVVRVHACGVCRTDLHVIDGDLTHGKLPIIPGHEVVGTVVSCGSAVEGYRAGFLAGAGRRI